MKVAPRFGTGHRILVTGGAGFVPSHLVDRLIERGCTVVALDNFITGSKENVAHLLGHPAFTLIEADISDGLPAHPAMAERFDAILHMASPASPTDFEKLPVEILRVGSVGTLALLERATDDGARFLMASTSEAYGDPEQHPQRETYWGNVNPVGIRSVYDEAKRFSEAATMGYHRSRGTDTAIVRIFNTYGPRMRPDDGRAIPTFIAQALRGEPITVHGTGEQTRSICYTEHELSMRRLAELIVSLADSRSEVTYITRSADDPEKRRPDLTLARELLGYEPTVAPEEGLRRTIDYYRGRLGY